MFKSKIFTVFLTVLLVVACISDQAAASWLSVPESDVVQPESETDSETLKTDSEQQESYSETQETDRQESTEGESLAESESEMQRESETDAADVTVSAIETESFTADSSAPANAAMALAGSAGSGARSTTYYYAGYQVRLDGALDTTGTLSGLTFTLYEKTPGGEWTKVGESQSTYTEYYKLTYVYFKSFPVEGTPVNEYKVVMSDNASYSMAETVVQLDPNWMAQYGSTIEGNYLSLTKKQVPEDNTDIMLSLGTPVWSGSGTAADPYTWAVTVDRFSDKVSVKTANEQAAIMFEGNSYTGVMTADLPYDDSVWDFSVKSADQTKETFYSITVTRTKYTPLPPSNLTAVTPSAAGGNDGEIQGLDAGKLYEYRSQDEADTDADYHQVPEGSTEITGLSSGTYYVRFQETWEYEPSKDYRVIIKEPVVHTLSLPQANIPDGVEVLDCPADMVEGREFTLRFKLPKNSLLDKVSYSYKSSSGWTISGTISKNDYVYSREGDDTIVTVTRAAFSGDATLAITLLSGNYYEISAYPQNGAALDERGEITLSGDEQIQGGIRYFKEGEITATVKVADSWKGYAEITCLKALSKLNGEEIEGSLTQVSDSEWTLVVDLKEDLDLYYDFLSYPADFTALDATVKRIGDLDKYVDDQARAAMEARLDLLPAYKKLTLKDQLTIDGYVTLLEEAYNDLTLRLDLSNDEQTKITVDEKEHTYDGKPWIPDVTVSYKGNVLTEGTDYVVVLPQDMSSPGKKQITVEFIGLYIGQKTVDVEIVQCFSITASAGAHGSIDPQGTVMVRAGENQTFVVLADEGYHIQSVYVNGTEVSLSENNEYTFYNVGGDNTIEAVFEMDIVETETEDTSETETSNTSGSETSDTSGKTNVSKDTNAVKTGDTARPALYFSGIILSLGVFCGVLTAKKKQKRRS